jgi:hypothetical protein
MIPNRVFAAPFVSFANSYGRCIETVLYGSRIHIEVYTRQPNQHWLLSEAEGLDGSIDLPAINCRLILSEVYAKVLLKQEQDRMQKDSA